MKLKTKKQTVESYGGVASSPFKSANNAKLFNVLSHDLYSNKPVAILRELSTNAYDAHIVAGCADKPFDWYLPTVWEPEFRIRDYGPGISNTDIMGTYSTLFASTKDDENEQVGAFGLGSKTPFAYTDSFTVVSRFEGVKSSYICVKDEKGIPRVDLFSVEESDEPSGLEVAFATKPYESDFFENAAVEVIEGFDIKPNILAGELVMKPDDHLYAANNWKISEPKSSYGYTKTKARIRQGCVIYPIDTSAIDGLSSWLHDLFSKNILIDVPIGSVSVVPSRENLSYDEFTKKNLIKIGEEVFDDVLKTIKETITTDETFWDASARFQKTFRKNILPRVMLSKINDHIRATCKGGRVNTEGWTVCGRVRPGKAAMSILDKDKSRETPRVKWKAVDSFTITPRLDSHVVVEDTSKKHSKPLKAAARIAYFRRNEDCVRELIWIKADVKSIDYKRLLVTLGRPPITNVEDLPEAPLEATSPSTMKPPLRNLTYGYGIVSTASPCNAVGFYVNMVRNQIVNEHGEPQNSCFDRFVHQLKEAQFLCDGEKIYGVPASRKKEAEKSDGLKPLYPALEAFLRKEITIDAASQAKKTEIVDQIHNYNFVSEVSEHVAVFGDVGPHHVTRRIYALNKQLEESEDVVEYIKTLRSIAHYASVTINADDESVDDFEFQIETLVNEFLVKYPMLFFIEENSNISRKELLQAASEYITMYDNNAINQLNIEE